MSLVSKVKSIQMLLDPFTLGVTLFIHYHYNSRFYTNPIPDMTWWSSIRESFVGLKTQGYSHLTAWGTWQMQFAWQMDLIKSRNCLTRYLDGLTSSDCAASRFTAVDSQPVLALKMLSTKFVETPTPRIEKSSGLTAARSRMFMSSKLFAFRGKRKATSDRFKKGHVALACLPPSIGRLFFIDSFILFHTLFYIWGFNVQKI